jgi:PAS domain S-box-containing protein
MPKVLIVDDEPSIRLTLAEFLRREGHHPLAAADAAQALELLDSAGGADVAVVDINLPGRGGIELLRELGARDPEMPVVMITGEPNVSQIPEIVRAGAYDFLPKPVLKETIIRTVARAAERRRLMSEKRLLEEQIRRHAEELEVRVAERTRELAAAHSFLNLVLDSSTDYAFVALDVGSRVTLFNRGAELLFGYAPGEVIGRKPRELFFDFDRYGRSLVESCADEEGASAPYRTEMLLHRKGGEEFSASVSITPIGGGGERVGHLLVIRDLTAERRAEDALRQMQARLARHEKIAALGRVAAQVAHEVKNPLSGLLLYTMHLREKLAGRGAGDEVQLADKVVETIRHLTNTVEQIMNFARPLSLSPREADLNRTVSEVVQLLRPQMEAARADCRLELAEGELRAPLDESSLRSALTNLILNAVQAMHGGGRLGVRTRREGPDLLVEVSDTGPGMTAEQVGNIFEAFYTTKSKGLGLGLPYAKRVVEQHGGEIRVESRPGEGTLVSVRLPAPTTDR